jgi:hypothetical protein
MMAYLQDAVVTGVALWAGVILFRRVAGFVRPKSAAPGCANCPSAAATRAPGAGEHPLVFIKSPRH